MKHVVEYKQHRNSAGRLITPNFIEDGGHFVKGFRMVGVTHDDAQMHIPSAELTKLTKEDLIARMEGHMDPMSEEEISAEKKEEIAAAFMAKAQ